jgi:NAD(P)-dependent dehydrogenase (short-subunit alcohol dehydrogenase family)
MKRVVLITGAGSGIGKSAARLFQRKGWYVIGLDRRTLASAGPMHRHIEADLSEITAPARIIKEIQARERRLDALVNNAAIQICKPAVKTSAAEWDEIMAINLRAAFLMIKECYPFLKKTHGAIVNVSSVHALVTSENISAYAATKGALLSFTRAVALEFAHDKIRVNAVLPGAIDTPMLRAGMSRGHLLGKSADQQIQALAQRHAMGRIGRPKDVAEAIYFLSSKQTAAFITGQSLVVDGGTIARLSTE